jgi:hypothetical protein
MSPQRSMNEQNLFPSVCQRAVSGVDKKGIKNARIYYK